MQRAAGTARKSASPPCPAKQATRVPGAGPVTPGPSSATVPQTSMPGAKGSAGFSW